MSLTKSQSANGCGGDGYAEWSDALPRLTEQDYEQMAAQWEALDSLKPQLQLTATERNRNESKRSISIQFS